VKTKFRFLTNLAVIMWFLCMLSVVTAGSMDYERQAERILAAAQVKGGLIVHVGCGAGELTAAMGGVSLLCAPAAPRLARQSESPHRSVQDRYWRTQWVKEARMLLGSPPEGDYKTGNACLTEN